MNLDKAIKEVLFETVVKGAIESAITRIPFLAFPVINPVFAFVFKLGATLIYDELAKRGYAIFVDIKTDYDRKKYDEAVGELKETIEKDINDAEKLKKAKDDFKSRLGNLVRFPAL